MKHSHSSIQLINCQSTFLSKFIQALCSHPLYKSLNYKEKQARIELVKRVLGIV